MRDEVPYHLIAAWCNKTISTSEQEELDNWLNLNQNNPIVFNQTVKLLQANLVEPNYPDTEKSWLTLQKNLKLNKTKSPIFNLTKIAAVLTATIIVGLVFKMFWYNQSLIKVSTAKNQIKQVSLPDGSIVWLNQNSQITYLSKMHTRSLTLVGEAYFEVTKNQDKPFTVETVNSLTTVLGTGFIVNTNPHDSLEGFVSVKHGKVQVVQKKSNLEVILINNQKAILGKKGIITQEPIVSNNEFAWQEKKLVFSNQNLKTILTDLSKYYQVTITVENEDIYNCKFTGEFTNPNLKDLLLVISKTLNLTYTISENIIVIKGSGC